MDGNKKIIVKAVDGRTIQTFRKVVRMVYDEGSVLGCTICGAKVNVASIEIVFDKRKRIEAQVQFDLHIWFQLNNDTDVIKKCVEFSDHLEIKKQGSEIFNNEEAFVWLKEDPKCLETIYITNPEQNQSAVQIEYTLEAEIIGDTVLNVKVFET